MDYPNRSRIKIWGEAEVITNDADLLEKVHDKAYKAKVERVNNGLGCELSSAYTTQVYLGRASPTNRSIASAYRRTRSTSRGLCSKVAADPSISHFLNAL